MAVGINLVVDVEMERLLRLPDQSGRRLLHPLRLFRGLHGYPISSTTSRRV
jgi:hypothetical protein